MHQYSPDLRRRSGNVTLNKIVEFAERAGWPVVWDRSGRPIGVGKGRINTADLLAQLDAKGPATPFRDVLRHFRRSGNAATHGGFVAWVEMLSNQGDPVLEGMMLRTNSAHVMYALELHIRAIDAWNASIEWSPRDLFEEGRKAAFAGVLLPYVDLARANRSR